MNSKSNSEIDINIKTKPNNKVALVTGASRGIGAASVKLLARQGYTVCLNYLLSTDKAEHLKQEILDFGGQCEIYQTDVSKEENVTWLFEQIFKDFGRLDVLINNVGMLKQQCRMADISEQRFLSVLTTNVMSCFLCSKYAVQHMSKKHGGQGGVIVNVSSGASKTGSPNEYVDYAASKGAMDSLTRGLALEVVDEGIRVNGIRPGLIDTEIHADGGEPNRIDRLKHKIPMQRGGSVDEVAEAIAWLVSEKSSFVTGTFIDVTGGL